MNIIELQFNFDDGVQIRLCCRLNLVDGHI